jgi:FkbM family methyltransferase
MENEPKLSELREAFKSESLSKTEYIHRASLIHDQLYDYSEVLKDNEINEIRIRPGEVEFIVGKLNLSIFCPRGESRYAPLEILNFGSYEPFESKILEILCLNANTIIDIGANIGWFTINFAALNPSSVIYAFEPLPLAHTFLELNVAVNKFENRIRIESLALSDKRGLQQFVQPVTNSTNSSFVNVANSENVVFHQVETTSVDEYFSNSTLTIDLIKCDVEGAELQVFLGASNTLKTYKPAIFTEILRKWSGAFGNHPNDLIQLLKSIGYTCFEVNKESLQEIEYVSEQTIATNFLFLTDSEVHKSILDLINVRGWVQN